MGIPPGNSTQSCECLYRRRGTRKTRNTCSVRGMADTYRIGCLLSVVILNYYCLSMSTYLVTSANAADVGQEVRDNGVGETDNIFFLTCNFTWTQYFSGNDYIMLQVNEIFDGDDYEIDLEGFDSWEGLFQIDPKVDWDNAPVIKHVHVIGGTISFNGGFIVQGNQKNFIVDSCSSSGTIRGRTHCDDICTAGGGICGHECSGTILLINCWSTGLIHGINAGGITGRRFGYDGGQTNITNCWSETSDQWNP